MARSLGLGCVGRSARPGSIGVPCVPSARAASLRSLPDCCRSVPQLMTDPGWPSDALGQRHPERVDRHRRHLPRTRRLGGRRHGRGRVAAHVSMRRLHGATPGRLARLPRPDHGHRAAARFVSSRPRQRLVEIRAPVTNVMNRKLVAMTTSWPRGSLHPSGLTPLRLVLARRVAQPTRAIVTSAFADIYRSNT